MPALPTTLPTRAEAVIHRLARQGLAVRSVWFPTVADLENWRRSGVPLYVRQLSATSVELGPRLDNLWASVFSPVWVLQLTDGPTGCEARWRRRPTAVTAAVLLVWAGILLVWPVAMWLTGDVSGVGFWLLLTAAAISAPTVGWIRGGKALDDGIPWLEAILLAPDEEEDW